MAAPTRWNCQNERLAAAKTGTTNDYKDAWTVGFTPQLVTGVWVGNSDNTPMENTPGSKGAAPIWNAVMSYALRDEPMAGWAQPPGITQMEVCATSGLLPTQWCPTRSEYFVERHRADHTGHHLPGGPGQPRDRQAGDRLYPARACRRKGLYRPASEAVDWLDRLSEEAQERWPQPPTEYDTVQGPAPGSGPVAILSPLPYAYVSGQVELLGNVQLDDFAFYRVAFGSGLNPSAWQLIGSEHGEQRNNELLEIWDVSELDGLYSLQLTAVRNNQSFEQAIIQVTVDNTPPEIELTFPLQNQEFFLPADEWVTFQPLVQDNVSMDRVEFYLDNRRVGQSAVAPFTYQWVIRGAVGNHTIHAIAYDAAGNSTTSASIAIRVTQTE